MKNTKQKEAIIASVSHLNVHPTADDIYSHLKKDSPRLSLGTVYRNLNAFSDGGQIQKISVPGQSDRFDFRLDEHQHVICERCGRVEDAEGALNLGSFDSLGKMRLTGYRLMLYGICKQCDR